MSTGTRPVRPWRRATSSAQVKSSSLATTNFTSSRGVRTSRFSQRLWALMPLPGHFRSTMRRTRGSRPSMGRLPLVSRTTSSPASTERRGGPGCFPGADCPVTPTSPLDEPRASSTRAATDLVSPPS